MPGKSHDFVDFQHEEQFLIALRAGNLRNQTLVIALDFSVKKQDSNLADDGCDSDLVDDHKEATQVFPAFEVGRKSTTVLRLSSPDGPSSSRIQPQ